MALRQNERLLCARVAGPSHRAKGDLCQDYVATRSSGGTFVLVACDGAGSAPLSAAGAEIVAETISDIFLDIASDLGRRQPGEWVIDEIVQAIVAARARIRDQCGPKNSITDYHTTLVAIVCHSTGGFICHIGDGWGVAVTEQSGSLNWQVSPPRNGEYANETFFITEGVWIKNVQVTPFSGSPVFAAVMTDGAGSLFQVRQELDFRKIVSFINEHSSTNESVFDFISSQEAEKASGDDKSIALFADLSKIRDIDGRQLPPPSTSPQIITDSSSVNKIPDQSLKNGAAQRKSQIKKKAAPIKKLIWIFASAIVLAVLITTASVWFLNYTGPRATTLPQLPFNKPSTENQSPSPDANAPRGDNQSPVMKNPQEQPKQSRSPHGQQLDDSNDFARPPSSNEHGK
jgi:hypothetical protein